MPLYFKKGDLFAEPAEALVNTVNCVGVMGKGVALEFKRRWPDNFRKYKQACDAKMLRPGMLYTHQVGDMFSASGPKFIINFPTKNHWRADSKIEYIETGLDALVDVLRRSGITSVALPPLGCGNGGLKWEEVRPLITRKLGDLDDVSVVVLEPKHEVLEAEHRVAPLTMTYPRAILIKALGDLELIFDGAFDRISLQKIVYFLQALGINYGMAFKKHLFGPYSESLRKAFVSLERQKMMDGFTSDDRLSRVTPTAYALADEHLNESGLSEKAAAIVDGLSKLIQGFEGPYGLELLSSVHHLASSEKLNSLDEITEAMLTWSENKRNKFSPKVIEAAYNRLRDDGLLSVS
jgi:O-acetyl-ADP-ribose deacetylase (regulator of RNase III)